MKHSTALALGVGVALVAGVGIYLVGRKAQQALNPLNRDNVAATTVNDVGSIFFSEPDDIGKNADGSWTLGGAIFDLINPSTAQAVRDITKPVQTTIPTDPETYVPWAAPHLYVQGA